MSDELETITESAKAAQEVAKLGAKIIAAAQMQLHLSIGSSGGQSKTRQDC